jgi:hypothetical protein
MNNRKMKILVGIALTLQVVFLLLVLVNAPEPPAAIKVGLERLQTNAPTEAATFSKTADGNWIIQTAGDYFRMADSWFRFIVAVAICSMLVDILIFILLLVFLRSKKETSPT